MKPIFTALAFAIAIAASTTALAQTHWESAQQAFEDFQDARAAEFLRRGAEAGDPRCQKAYGLMLRFGHLLFPAARIVKDQLESQIWLARAVEAEVALGVVSERAVPAR